MGRLKRQHRARRRPPIGDLDQRVDIQNREQKAPQHGSVDASMLFSDVDPTQDTVWAKVVTTNGKTYFDGVASDRRITHEITIRWMSGVSAQSWVILPDGQRLDVVHANDLEERNEWLLLMCDATGEGVRAASGN